MDRKKRMFCLIAGILCIVAGAVVIYMGKEIGILDLSLIIGAGCIIVCGLVFLMTSAKKQDKE